MGGRSVTIIYGRLETPIYASKKTQNRFINPYKNRFQTPIYDCNRTPLYQKKTKTKIISVLQYHILIVSKQPFIYASKETLICFTKPYNRRFKTAIYAFKKTHTSFFKNGRFLASYKGVWKWHLYGL